MTPESDVLTKIDIVFGSNLFRRTVKQHLTYIYRIKHIFILSKYMQVKKLMTYILFCKYTTYYTIFYSIYWC